MITTAGDFDGIGYRLGGTGAAMPGGLGLSMAGEAR